MSPLVRIVTTAFAIAFCALAAPVAGRTLLHLAQSEPVDLELVLAVDISWSMDPEEQKLQRDGYVTALRDPEVQKAMLSGAHRRIAITYFEWAGPEVQRIVLPWMVIGSVRDAEAVADALAAAPISRERKTSISGALRFAEGLLAARPKTGARQVIDVSGDGANNAGPPVTPIRDELVAKDVVINGLPIVLRPSTSSIYDIPNLPEYYETCVIGGPGSFMIPIRETDEFHTATRRKILLEVAGRPAEVHRAQVTPPAAVDCMVGEKMFQRFWDR